MAEGNGRGSRGRALLFRNNRTSDVTDDQDSLSDRNNETTRPRGRATFLRAIRSSHPDPDARATVSGSSESGVLSGDASSVTLSSSDRPKGRGRAAIFGSKSSSSGVFPSEITSLSSNIQELQITDQTPKPSRSSPDKERSPPIMKHGINGQKIGVAVNYVRLDLLDPSKGIWEYEVIFGSEVDILQLRSDLVHQHWKTLSSQNNKVYDRGSRLYTPTRTAEEVTSGFYKLECGDEVKVTFKRKCQRKFSDCRYILNIIMRQIKAKLKLVNFGRSDFNPQARTRIPEFALEIWPGCITAVEEYEGGILLNCDVSHRVLQSTTVYDMILDCHRSGSGEAAKERIEQTLLGRSVLTKYTNKVIRIDEVAFTKNPMDTFEKDGKEITFVDYYKNKYNLTIHDKKQPLLVNRLKKKPMGKEKVDILNYYVPELCSPTGMTDEQRKNFRLMKEVKKVAELTPQQRDEALKKFLQGIHDNPVCKKILEDWGLRLPVEPLQLTARTLDAETIYFGKDRFVTEPTADWTRALSSNRMLMSVNLDDWAIICTARDKRTAGNFYEKAKDLYSRMGVRINKPELILVSDDARSYRDTLRTRAKLQIVVIILPSNRGDHYEAVKKLCVGDLGLPTQVIISRTLQKEPRALGSVILKVMLQINCKVGGSLWGVNIPHEEDGVMFCGLDVYHERAHRSSSIVALVCSINKNATRWSSATARHENGQEVSDKIMDLFRECLHQFYSSEGKFPKRIIVFRDGVGDGSIRTIRDLEIPQFDKIFEQVSQDYSPALTYLIVQKRINTRYYVKQRGRFENPPPGSVLDHTITRRDHYDFFLISQNARQGTVTPTHYIVVEDRSDMSPDLLQKITYKMTHLYYNWSGTVRVPAPCQYAHKLAYLIGEHVHKPANSKLKNTLYYL